MSYSFNGDFSVPTSREQVYAVLSEVNQFAPLLPTYISHEMKADGSALVRVKVGVGKIRGTGEVVLTAEENIAPLRASYTGKGKIMGGAFNINAGFELEDTGAAETRVIWRGEMAIFGKLVSLAGGLVQPIAERDINAMIHAVQVAFGGAIEVEPVAVVHLGLMARFLAWLKRLFGSNPEKPDAKKPDTNQDKGPGA